MLALACGLAQKSVFFHSHLALASEYQYSGYGGKPFKRFLVISAESCTWLKPAENEIRIRHFPLPLLFVQSLALWT
jgi:hypothetical protein